MPVIYETNSQGRRYHVERTVCNLTLAGHVSRISLDLARTNLIYLRLNNISEPVIGNYNWHQQAYGVITGCRYLLTVELSPGSGSQNTASRMV